VSGAAAPLRPRRRRALASALRHAVAAEGAPPGPAALEAGLRAVAAAQGVALPPEADRPEMLARLEPGGAAPPEFLAALAALLLPLFRPDPQPRSEPR